MLKRKFKGTLLLIALISLLVTIVHIIPKEDKPNKERQSKSNIIKKYSEVYPYYGVAKQICKNVVRYGEFMVEFKNLLINASKVNGRFGGEDFKLILNQAEHVEYVNLEKGFFNVECSELKQEQFLGRRSHFPEFLQATQLFLPNNINFEAHKLNTKVILFVKRFEYVNLHHCTTEWFNAYLAIRKLHISPTNVHVLLLDAHPKSILDAVWSTLFSGYSFIGQYRFPRFFNQHNLIPTYADNNDWISRLMFVHHGIWSPYGYDSPLTHLKSPQVHLIEEYRDFFLKQHGVEILPITLLKPGQTMVQSVCRPKVIVILRRNYVSHPRQKTVGRKLANENEILYNLEKAIISKNLPLVDSVLGVQFDTLSMSEQLKVVSNADILIGVHGAGMTHALHMPTRSAVIELFPMSSEGKNYDFEAISRWKKHVYIPWRHSKPDNEINFETLRIPPKLIIELVKDAISQFQRKFLTCV